MTFYIEYLTHTGPFMRRLRQPVQPECVPWPEGVYAFQMWDDNDGEPRKVGPVYYHPDTVVDAADEGLVIHDRFGRRRPWDAGSMRIIVPNRP